MNSNSNTSSNWIEYLENVFHINQGKFTARDTAGTPIILGWEKVDRQSPRLNQIIQELSAILAHTYTSMELEFAREYPDQVPTEFFLKSLAPFFEKGIASVDWVLAKTTLHTNLLKFF